jgi:phosphoglycolate phosphatase-like HAD superfamily hydrolase
VIYLFDIDGTILLTGGAGAVAINEVFSERYGLEGSMDHIRAGGKTDPLIVHEIFVTRLNREPEPGEIDAIIDDYVPRLRTEIGRSANFRTMPSVFDVLDFLGAQSDVHLGIATGNVREGARAKLDHIDLWDRFPFGGFGDDAADRPGLVQRAIDRGRAHAGEDLPTERIVIVGDTVRDVTAAQACDARVLAVATGSVDRPTLEASGPTATFDTLAELPAWHQAFAG